jgi:hypothetical protein
MVMIEVYDTSSKWVAGYVEVASATVPDAIAQLTHGDYVARVVAPTPLKQMVTWVRQQEARQAQYRREGMPPVTEELFATSPLFSRLGEA